VLVAEQHKKALRCTRGGPLPHQQLKEHVVIRFFGAPRARRRPPHLTACENSSPHGTEDFVTGHAREFAAAPKSCVALL